MPDDWCERAGYYRWRLPPLASPVQMELQHELQKIALEWPAYGYRRITAELNRRGFDVNHKRVLRLMHVDNLLCLRSRSFVITTDSRHAFPVYPNLAREMKPNAVNQLWVAHITYIRLRTEFIYLAVVLDALSRKVIGWALGRTLEAELSGVGTADGSRTTAAGTRTGASFRPWCAVCLACLHGPAQGVWRHHQHEPEGEPLRQRCLRIIHENTEIRGDLSQRLPRSERSSFFYC